MKHIEMTNFVTTVLVSLSLIAACGSDNNKTSNNGGASSLGGAGNTGGASNTGGTVGTSSTSAAVADPCGTGLCAPSGFPFVRSARAISDACGYDCPILAADTAVGETTATMSQPEAGKLCLTGIVSPGGWAQIGLFFVDRSPDRTEILNRFDANALGITQVAFTIDSPPSGGLTVTSAVTVATSCPADFTKCIAYGFDLMTAPGSSVRATYTVPGPQIAPFANFLQTAGTQRFDTSALLDLVFAVGDGPYDFCIHDFKFLDVHGNEVVDTQRPDAGS
jgi:hypothetical protein